MNDFLTRLIPGFIYVSLLIGSLLYSQFLFVLLMFEGPGVIPEASWRSCGPDGAGNAPNGAVATCF